MSNLSIIIPTHNRSRILEQTLAYLEKQTVADQIEVIVINDVPDDKEYERLAKANWHIPIHFEAISPCHQGVARNHGMQKAQSSTVLFIGDDIFLDPNACETHLHLHNSQLSTLNSLSRTPIAVLGHTQWDPAINITPVMQWLDRSGWQFGYPKIKHYTGKVLPEHLQHQFTYTSHISVSKDIALRTPFREDVTLYGWEDTEWGMRLRQNGVQVFYEPRALALHHHTMNLEQSLKRMETIGVSAVTMSTLVPEFDRLPRGWKRIAYEIAALMPTMAGRHRQAFLKGMKHASHM